MEVNKHKTNKFIATYIIAIFSIVLYVFVDRSTNLNYLQVYSMYLSPFLLLFLGRITKREMLFYILMIIMLISGYYNTKSFRSSTIFYTYLFIITYILYSKTLRIGSMNITYYLKVLKIIIYLYAIVLIIQQISVIVNVPVFNQCWSFSSNKFKLNSLSMEPSNTTLILPLLMFSYIRISEVIDKRDYSWRKNFATDKLVWLAYLYVMLTCGSMTTFFSLPVFFLYFFRKRIRLSTIFFGIITFLIAFFIVTKFNNKALLRFQSIWTVIFSFDPAKIGDQDISAAVRFVPYIEFFKNTDLFNLHTWLGHGIDSSEKLYTLIILGADNADRNVGAMNITSLFYDYGYVAGTIFIIALKRAITSKFFSYEMLFYLLLFSILTINHYVLWLFLILMSTNYYFKTQIDNK